MPSLSSIIALLQAVAALLGALHSNPNLTQDQLNQANLVVGSVTQFVANNIPTTMNAPITPDIQLGAIEPVAPVTPPPPTNTPTNGILKDPAPIPTYTIQTTSTVSAQNGGWVNFSVLDKTGTPILGLYDEANFKGARQQYINYNACGPHAIIDNFKDSFSLYYQGKDSEPNIDLTNNKLTLQLKFCGEKIEAQVDAN